jgi:hypothetical protein
LCRGPTRTCPCPLQKPAGGGYKADDSYLKYLSPDAQKSVKERNKAQEQYMKGGQGGSQDKPKQAEPKIQQEQGKKQDDKKEAADASCSGGGGGGGGADNILTKVGHDGQGGDVSPGEALPNAVDKRTGGVAMVGLEGANSLSSGTFDIKTTGQRG